MPRPSIAVAKVKALLVDNPNATIDDVHKHLGSGTRHRAGLVLQVAKGIRPTIKVSKKVKKVKKVKADPVQLSLPLNLPKLPPDKRQETNSITKILTERGKQYGSFVGHAYITQKLKALMIDHANANAVTLEADQQEALEMIAHKIGRIVNGNPNYADSWTDIAGYAQLVADRLLTNTIR
jgi:hypothetical protein